MLFRAVFAVCDGVKGNVVAFERQGHELGEFQKAGNVVHSAQLENFS